MAKKGGTQLRDDEFISQVGRQIAYIRKQKGWTQTKLAEECHIDLDYSQIARMERGEVNFTISYLSVVAKALDVDPKELLP